MREQVADQILQQVEKELREEARRKKWIGNAKDRILKVRKEYSEAMKKGKEEYIRKSRYTKNQIYAILSYLEGIPDENFPLELADDFGTCEAISEEISCEVSNYTDEIDDSVYIDHEEYYVTLGTHTDIFTILYNYTLFDKEIHHDFEIEIDYVVEEAIRSAIDKTERLVMRRSKRNNRLRR